MSRSFPRLVADPSISAATNAHASVLPDHDRSSRWNGWSTPFSEDLGPFARRALGACPSIPREPRWQGEGADARRAVQAVVGSTVKPRNAVDAPPPANP